MTGAQEIRRSMRAMRRALDEGAQQEASHAVCERVLALGAYRDARCVMAYMACGGEISLQGVIEDVLSSGRTLALPRCEAPGVMTARRVSGMGDLVCGMYGLAEPDERCAVIDPERIDLVLAPGTAFDPAGHRLGQGGGYYDRFLPGTGAMAVGVCHGFALMESVPFDKHDYRMDMVITPGGTICCPAHEKRQEE